jgi:hypothetical protein
MKIRVLLCMSVLALLICATTAPANAQDNRFNVFAGYTFGTNNFACSLAFELACGIGIVDPGLHGYTAAFAYNFNNHIGLEANFSGHNGTTTLLTDQPTSSFEGENAVISQDLYTYVFGPKLSLPVGNFVLFTHFLVGASHSHEGGTDVCIPATGGDPSCFISSSIRGSSNGMAFKTGGGVDWNHGHWGIRILEVDYSHNQIYGTTTETCSDCSNQPASGDSSWNAFELSTGVTFNFGGK